jgi:hypothetical protein
MAALILVSYNLSHGVHSDKLSHNERSYLFTNKTTEIPLLLLCTMKLFFVKCNDLAGLAHRHHAQEGKFMESGRCRHRPAYHYSFLGGLRIKASSFLRDSVAFLSVVQALTAVNRSCNRGAGQ